MQASYLDAAPTAQWYRNYSRSVHRRKLKDIQQQSKRPAEHSLPRSFKMLPKPRRDREQTI